MPRNHKPKFTHPERLARRKKMARAVRKGQPAIEVAKEYKVTLATVYTACEENGVETRTRTDLTAFRILARLVATTDTLSVVATELGESREYVRDVYHAAREAGIPIPARKQGPKKSAA